MYSSMPAAAKRSLGLPTAKIFQITSALPIVRHEH